MGNGAVGKSSMIQRYCRGSFTKTYKKTSSGIYGVSGISMDIPVISIFQDPATHFTKSGDIL